MTKNSGKGFKMLGAALLMIIFSAYSRGQDIIPKLIERLEAVNSVYHKQKAYVFTDRYVYHAGEIIWFRGYVTSADGSRESHSADFYIKVFDSNGEEIFFRRYPLVDNMVSGKLQLPASLIPGKYKMLAYTGWMKNQPAEDVFSKEILISGFLDKRLSAEAIFDKMIYSPGDTMNVFVQVRNHEGLPIQSTEFIYTLESFSKQLIRGTGITDNSGNAKITAVLPDNKGEVLSLSVELKRRNTAGRFSVYIPLPGSTPIIRLMPESGNLVKGFENLVFLDARDINGLPLSIRGGLYDENDKLIKNIGTGFNGQGSFMFLPDGKQYYFRIHDPLFADEFYRLPDASDTGTAIRLNDLNSDSASFTVMSTVSDSLFVLAVAEKKIIWRYAGKGSSFDFTVPVGSYNGDILQLTVFNIDNKPLCERIVEIPGKEVIRMYANRKSFLQRQRVTLTLDYSGSEEFMDLALSVSPQNMSEHGGMQTFMQSAFYDNDDVISLFYDKGPSLFIEPGFKPVDWDKLLSIEQIEPYRNQDGLAGIVADKKDIATQLAKVRITHIPGYRSFETQTDNNGHFRVFFGQDVIDFNYLNIEAYDATGRISLNTSVDYNFSEKLKQKVLAKDSNVLAGKLSDLLAYGDPDIVYALRYNPAKLRKDEKTSDRKYDPYSYRDFSNTPDIIRDIRDYDIVDGKIFFRDIERQFDQNSDQKAAIIVINGVLWGDRIDVLNSITPSDITNLVISSSLSDIHRYTAVDFAAVIEITTIQGMYRYRQRPFRPIRDLAGAQNDFLSPDYSVETITSPDNRRTLYWNPEIRLTPGNPVTLSFFTSDVKGVFSIRAEGMDSKGVPFTITERITVE